MPLYDEYAQQVPFPVQTDRANIRAWGEALVDSVVQRSVMRFPSRAVRGAVITDPKPGMQSWIDDVQQMEMYDGGRWVTMAAGTSSWTTISRHPGYTLTNPGNNDQGDPEYRVVNLFGQSALMLRGGVGVAYEGSGSNPTTQPNGGIMTSVALPVHARPSTLRTVPAAASIVGGAEPTVKLDIQTTGHLRFVGIGGAGNNPPWVSLNGIMCSL